MQCPQVFLQFFFPAFVSHLPFCLILLHLFVVDLSSQVVVVVVVVVVIVVVVVVVVVVVIVVVVVVAVRK